MNCIEMRHSCSILLVPLGVIARASEREGALELLGMRHPDRFRKIEKLRQFLCIEGACVHRPSWHSTLLLGLGPQQEQRSQSTPIACTFAVA